MTGDFVAFNSVRHTAATVAPDYAVSATGTLVYVPGNDSVQGYAREVVWVDRNGAEVKRAVEGVVDTGRDPRLSPDGTRLVLTTGLLSDGDLWVYDLRGRPAIPLALAGNNRLRVWNPDSSRVAFARTDGISSVYLTPADGSVTTPEPLRDEPVLATPVDWPMAGELIMTRFAGTGLDIVTTPTGPQGAIRDVVATEVNEADAALSPDGRWLAYLSDRTGTSEIWALRYPDGAPRRVSNSGGFEPRWSGDGGELFYIDDDAMIAVTFDKETDAFGTPVELFPRGPYLFEASTNIGSYDVARDGRFLLVRDSGSGGSASEAEPASIVVVQNWFEELVQRAAPPQR